MSTEIYPECSHDDIRKHTVDLTSPLDQHHIKRSSKTPKPNNFMCVNCNNGKVLIAKGNRFDFIDAIY